MSVDVALTADEIAALAGPSMPRYFLVWDTASGPNVVATARVNAPGGITYPLTTVPVNSTSAGWANVAKGMVIFIGSIAGSFDGGIYRVRKAGTGSTLEIMAVGVNDGGIGTFVERDNAIVDGEYITVLYSLDIFGAFPRIDYPGTGLDATIYEDWDLAYTNFNQYPPPLINVFIKGRPENYATHVYSGTSDAFDIDLEIGLWPTSASATWAITLPSGVTLNSGSLTGSGTSATINVTVPHSADNYMFKFVATEDHGNSFTAYRKVWVKSNTYPPARVVRIDMDEDGIDGSRRTVTLNQLVGAPPGCMFHLFDMGFWNGTDVPSAIHAFTGYCISQKESTDIGVANVTLELIGPSLMLEHIGGQSQIMEVVSGDPANYQQIVADLSYIDFIIWWIMVQRVAGLLQQYNCTLFGFSNTEKRMTAWQIDTGTLFEQIQRQAQRVIGGNFGCDPGGEIMLRIRPSRVWGVAARDDIPRRCSLTENNYTHIDQGAATRPQVRRLRTEAFYSDASTVTPVWADAPQIPGQGQSEQKLDRLVVDSPLELYRGTGLEYAARNNKYPNGTTVIKKNYAVIKPAQMLRVHQSVAARLRYDLMAWANYTLVTKVSRTHNPDGTIDTTLSWEAETNGTTGVDAPIPVPDASQYSSHYQRTPFAMIPFARAVAKRNGNTNPAGTKKGAAVIPRDGSIAFCGTVSHAYIAMTFLGTPTYRDVTPSGLGNFQIQHGMIQFGGARAWLLVSDGTNSKVYTTANVFATPRPTWAVGTPFSDIYTLLRTTPTANNVLVYSPASASATLTKTVTFDAGSYSYSLLEGTYSGSGGNPNGNIFSTDNTPPPSNLVDNRIRVFLPAASTVVNIKIDYWKSYSGAVLVEYFLYDGIGTQLGHGAATLTPSDGVWNTQDFGAISVSGVAYIEFRVAASNFGLNGVNTAKMDNCEFSYTAVSGGTAVVRLSTNNGSTFGSAISVGTSPGAVGGFDTPISGTVSYGAELNEVKKASTLGGSYSNDQAVSGTSANLIEVPWYTRGSLITVNGGSSPEYILGTLDPDGSGNSLYWVVGGSPVNISPVLSGTLGICVSANSATTWKGKYVAGLFSFGGSVRLSTSIDGGSTWRDRAAATGASYIRVRRRAATPGQLYIAGNGILQYSPDFGATLINKARPSSIPLVFFEPAF